ncbi:MAG TPA: DUF1952 domain-containing protein [Chloroflexota bacterium]|nr:DUF1952 domain-containing protein [Chloroflexota bacterium]HUM70768.1 DUF1952 domain-containing protein [Chloroflexota bacterium]
MATIDRVIRGIPAWLMGEYLQEMGGLRQGDGRYTHPQWSATVKQIEDYQIGSLVVGQIQFHLQADDAIIEPFQKQLDRKLLRGGG